MWKIGLAVLCAVTACARADQPTGHDSPGKAPIGVRAKLRGAGATFPSPAYAAWIRAYREQTGITIAYEERDSQVGVTAAAAGNVDFGGTDIPLSDEQLERDGLVQFPMVIGAVVPVVNLPGIEAGQLVLSPQTLGQIFLGDITRWNGEPIRAENPGLELPDREITPIHRADPSGSTWIFSSSLARCCNHWRERIGVGADLPWPVGVGARSNDQVARFVRQFEYTIAYIELTHAEAAELAWVALRMNGHVATPEVGDLAKVATQSTWQVGSSIRVLPPDVLAKDVWPFVGASYLVLQRERKSVERARKLFPFLHWALTDGAPLARELSYATVPAEHVTAIEELWRTQIRVNGKAVW